VFAVPGTSVSRSVCECTSWRRFGSLAQQNDDLKKVLVRSRTAPSLMKRMRSWRCDLPRFLRRDCKLEPLDDNKLHCRMQQLRMMSERDVFNRLHEIIIPVICRGGKKDLIVPSESTRNMVNAAFLIYHSRRFVLEDERFFEEMDEFLRPQNDEIDSISFISNTEKDLNH